MALWWKADPRGGLSSCVRPGSSNPGWRTQRSRTMISLSHAALLSACLIGCQDTFTGSKAGDERQVALVKLCWCPPGSFLMGSPPSEPERRPGETQVQVRLTRGFWIGKYEVTQGDWKRVVGA